MPPIEPKPTDYLAGRSDVVWEWIKRAGIAKDDDRVRRVVIDIDVESFVKVYVEKVGTRQMLMVEPLDFSRNIVMADKPDDYGKFTVTEHYEFVDEEGGDASAVA